MISGNPAPGFQGSETSRPQVVIYTHGNQVLTHNAISQAPSREIKLDGKNRQATTPSLISLQTTKALGPAAGGWSAQVKVPESQRDMWEEVMDDDWIDISLMRHGRVWHVMRGLVRENRRGITVGGQGATATTYNLTGTDFGAIWEKTPVWFSQFAAQNVSGHFSSKVFSAQRADAEASGVAIQGSLVLNSPAAAVRGYLLGFLESLSGIGRENWDPPSSLDPRKLTQLLELDVSWFENVPERIGIDPNFMMPSGTLWDLAKQWSDPLYTELFVDLLPFPQQDVEQGLDNTNMGIVYRDKPFPIATATASFEREFRDLNSRYFQLPTFVIPRQDIGALNVGRSGDERYNAFFITSQLHQETIGAASVDLTAPLWDTESVKRHGLRRFDVNSRYSSVNADLLNLATSQRALLRDWYCLNPWFLSGTLELRRPMPEIRIGTRVRVPGIDQTKDETYYVESVSHTWNLMQGVKTSLGVTRGWKGTDLQLLDAIRTVAAGYSTPARSVPGS